MIADIRGALLSRLTGTPGCPAYAPEGVTYRPTVGTPYLAPVLVTATSRPTSVDARSVSHKGTFEVVVFYPDGRGTAAIDAMCDAILARFAPPVALVLGTARVAIRFAERRGSSQRDDGWLRAQLSIGWRCDVRS